MINKELTNTYLSSFDLLTEALFLCWTNSFCIKSSQLDPVKLKEQIHSYGLYDHKHAIKKAIPTSFGNNIQFKTLVWANKFSGVANQNILCEYTELHNQVISEIENNLFVLKNKGAQIAYANILLRNLDKSHIHKRKLRITERDMRYKEMFELVLNYRLDSDNECLSHDDNPSYDLTARLLNHLDFIDKLIELFLCFDICLINLADKAKCNLYIFKNNKIESNNNADLQTNAFPKFNSNFSNDCLIKIMQYLFHKKMLDNPNSDTWLFWFNRKHIKNPEYLKWKGSPTMLSNIIQHLCDENVSATIKTAFCTNEYVKPTKKRYEHSKTHKEIEQIITVTKQKKRQN